jgi:hypothetical protein
MSDIIDDTDDPTDDDENLVVDDLDEAEPSEAELADATVPPDPAAAASGAQVESIQELLVKQEAAEEEDDDADEAVIPLTREERLAEPVETRVVPIQETEFTCTRCFLVKHRSQLADKKKMRCRDCA